MGWGMGVTAADYNADGWPDLYLANYGPNALYENEGDGTFVDVAAERGVDFSGWEFICGLWRLRPRRRFWTFTWPITSTLTRRFARSIRVIAPGAG